MAYTAVYRITIRAPQQEVFNYVADVSRHGDWGSADDHMKASAEALGAPAAAARHKAEGMLNGKLNESVVTVTTLEAPMRLILAAEDSNSIFIHKFLFSAAEGGTRVERHVTMAKGPFYFPIVLSLFRATVQKDYNGAMANLKTKMEG